MYYLQSRYYDPEVGRFLNGDALVNPGQGFSGHNVFIYCGNNPVARIDLSGNAGESIWDIISLACSIKDVISDPTDPWAWAGLIGDVIDVAIPFIGGIGETARAVGAAIVIAQVTNDCYNALSSPPIVIGESMDRVEDFARKNGAEVFNPPSGVSDDELMSLNRRWIQEAMDQGRVIYDIGLDPSRSKRSAFYAMEQALTEGYAFLKKVKKYF